MRRILTVRTGRFRLFTTHRSKHVTHIAEQNADRRHESRPLLMNFHVFFPYDRNRPIIFCEEKREIARSYDPFERSYRSFTNRERKRALEMWKKIQKVRSTTDLYGEEHFNKRSNYVFEKMYEKQPCSFIASYDQ